MKLSYSIGELSLINKLLCFVFVGMTLIYILPIIILGLFLIILFNITEPICKSIEKFFGGTSD